MLFWYAPHPRAPKEGDATRSNSYACSGKPSPSLWIRVASITLLVLCACAAPREASWQRGSGGPGPSPGLREAFDTLDASEGQRLAAIEQAVAQLRRFLTFRYREAIVERSLPELRKMRANARAYADAGRWREAGNLLQATLVATQLVVLEVNLVLVADWADQEGQSSFQIVSQISAYDADMMPLLAAALSEDPARLAAELPEGSRRFEKWLGSIDGWCAAVKRGSTLSHRVIQVLDGAMLVYGVRQAAVVAAEAYAAGRPPPADALFPGGVAAATQIDVAALEAMSEAIRKLLAAGVLDPAVVAGMGQLGAAAARPGLTSPASLTMQGLPLPDTTAVARTPGRWVSVNEAMSDRARAYQVKRGGRPGKAYQVGDVKFDAFRDGKLIEAKGQGYEAFVEKKGPPTFREWFTKANDLVRQAERQARVAKAAGLPVQWEVAEPRFAAALRQLFRDAGVKGVTVVCVPP